MDQEEMDRALDREIGCWTYRKWIGCWTERVWFRCEMKRYK